MVGGTLFQGTEAIDFPKMTDSREQVVKELLVQLGIPDDLANIEEGGQVRMWLTHVNRAPFMPFKFGGTPFGTMLWQVENLVVL